MKVVASKLNVRSGPGTDYKVLSQLLHGSLVTVEDARDDWVYVLPACGWVNRIYLAPETLLINAPSPSSIESIFGPACGPLCSAGRVQLPAPLKLGWKNERVTRVACHVIMVPIFEAVFAEIHALGLWELIKTFDGIYQCRDIKNTNEPSTHSWGISVDLNAATNRQGTEGDMDPRIVAAFVGYGFFPGARFTGKRRDPMHFEFVRRV